MRFLRKVTDYLAPILTTNTFDEFKTVSNNIFSLLNAPDSAIAFSGALNNIQDYLSDEIKEDKPDQPCVHFFISNNILGKLVSEISESLPPGHVEPLLKFFLGFVDTNLNRLFPQIAVHRPFAKLLSFLPMFALKDARETHRFANDLWNSVKDFPLALELLAGEDEQPLIDFFCLTSFAPGETGEVSRSALLSIAGLEGGRFGEYLEKRYFPGLAEFILNTAQCGSTIQFNGSLASLAEWIDRLLLLADRFPCDIVLKGVGELVESQRILAVAFLLSFFSADAIVGPVGEFALSGEFLGAVVNLLKNMDDPVGQKSAVAFLRAILESELDLGAILPPPGVATVEVLSRLPQGWLAGLEGSTAMDAYESDALVRLQFFRGRYSRRGDSGIFNALLGVLAAFRTIPISLALSTTKAITAFLSVAPDLIGAELVQGFTTAVETLADVTEISLPGEGASDSPELRAIILTEFGKEVHATFVASERLTALPLEIAK
jgi:hypothetical protein